MTLEELVGRTLVIGIPGIKITPEIIRHFKELHAGGLILYRINFASPAQLKKLISDLEEGLERKLLVTADHEGGRVIMFGEGVTIFPDNLALARTKNAAYARKQGEIEAKELRRLGIDVNLSPVLDVLTESYSPNIGIRSYGKDWRLVAEMGCARIAAMQKNGLSACAKHFPGKGHAPVDAHLGLPTIRSTWQEMEKVHVRPFRAAIKAGIDVVMSSHPYYPNLDPDPQNIATFSRRIIHDYLRVELGFKGVISSDDLEMGAIKAICGIGEAGIRAAHAGHDLLLVCHDLGLQKEVYRSLLAAYRVGRLKIPDLEASVQRIEDLKSKRKKRFEGGALRADSGGGKITDTICSKGSVTLGRAERPALKGKKITVIFPRFSELAEKIMIEKEVQNETAFVAKEFKRYRLKPRIEVVSIEPSEQEIRRSAEAARDADVAVYFCFDAHLYKSNLQLLQTIQNSGKKTIVALLRDPYDEEFLSDKTWGVTCFGWRACQIRACIAKICQS